MMDTQNEKEELWADAETESVPALLVPYPAVELAGEGQQPTESELAALLKSPRLRQLRERYTSLEQAVEIAGEFTEWVKKQPAPGSVLLSAEDGVDYWFAGDLHASFEVLLRAFALVSSRARQSNRQACLVLLGDIIDRGTEELACLAMVEDWLMCGEMDGVRLLCLQGNHDVALQRSMRGGFSSYVIPAETADILNFMYSTPGERAASEVLGRAAMELAASRPVMAEITNLGGGPPEGSILLVHAGLPHTDLQGNARKQIAQFRCLTQRPLHESVPADEWDLWTDDMLWNRMRPGLKSLAPRRGFAGNLMGVDDVNTYRRLHHTLTGRAICCVVRGHDHIPAGWCLYSYHPQHNPRLDDATQHECTMLGINTMRIAGNPMLQHACPMLAHWQRGAAELRLHNLIPS